MDQTDEGTYDDLGRDGLTNFTLWIKEQATRLTLFFFFNMMMMKYDKTTGRLREQTDIRDVKPR
jgi:hypothetical protein